MNTVTDPRRLKKQMADWLLAILYNPYFTRQQNTLDSLINRNMRLQESPYQCFTYKGEYYGPLYSKPILRPKLHPELHPEMVAFVEERSRVNVEEMPYITNYITKVLNSSDSYNDWLKLLPDCMKAPVYELLASEQSQPDQLTNECVAQILAEHDVSIQKMKQRMATNLILN